MFQTAAVLKSSGNSKGNTLNEVFLFNDASHLPPKFRKIVKKDIFQNICKKFLLSKGLDNVKTCIFPPHFCSTCEGFIKSAVTKKILKEKFASMYKKTTATKKENMDT